MKNFTYELAMEWVDSQPNPFLKVADVARHFGVSQSNLGYYIPEHQRRALQAYINQRRSLEHMQFIISFYQVDDINTLATLTGLKVQSLRNVLRTRGLKWFNTSKLSKAEFEMWVNNQKIYQELFYK